jgi:O-antigen ligase
MGAKSILRVQSILESASLAVALLLCSVVPLICYPNVVLSGPAGDAVDFFIYGKAFALYLLGGVSTLILLAQGVPGSPLRRKIRIKATLLLFTVWVAVATCFSSEPETSIRGYTFQNLGLLSHLSFFIIFTLVLNNFRARNLNLLICATLSSSFLIAVSCIFEYFGVHFLAFLFQNHYTFPTQVHATFGNSNNVGSYFSLTVPLAMMLSLRCKGKRESTLLLIPTIVCLWGLIVSGSRISLACVLATCLVCIVSLDGSRLLFRKFCAVLAFTFAVSFMVDAMTGSAIRQKYLDAGSQTRDAASTDLRRLGSNRLYAYEKFIKLTLKSPRRMLVGVGPDCLYLYGWTSYEDAKTFPDLANVVFCQAHSDVVEYAATMGIPALVFYGGFLLSVVLAWWSKINSATPAMTGLFAGWLGYVAQSFFNFPNIGVIGVFFIFSAVLSAQGDDPGDFCPLTPKTKDLT